MFTSGLKILTGQSVEVTYLAGPYADADPAIEQWRAARHAEAANIFVASGLHIFSPIVHGHGLLRYGELGDNLPVELRDGEYWMALDLMLMQACSQMYVLALPGWHKSVGTEMEMFHADQQGLETFVISYATLCQIAERNCCPQPDWTQPTSGPRSEDPSTCPSATSPQMERPPDESPL